MKIVSENQFSGKTYFYTIASSSGGGGRQQRGEQDGGAGPAEGRPEAERDGGGTGQLLLEDP